MVLEIYYLRQNEEVVREKGMIRSNSHEEGALLNKLCQSEGCQILKESAGLFLNQLLNQFNKSPGSKWFPRAEAGGAHPYRRARPCISSAAREACVMSRAQLRKHFTGARQPQPVLSQQLE